MTDWLQVQSVSVCYDAQSVVDQVSFGLVQGEIGCLLGASGCGKTTLLRSLADHRRLGVQVLDRLMQHLPRLAVTGQDTGIALRGTGHYAGSGQPGSHLTLTGSAPTLGPLFRALDIGSSTLADRVGAVTLEARVVGDDSKAALAPFWAQAWLCHCVGRYPGWWSNLQKPSQGASP